MFLLRRPSPALLERLHREAHRSALSYAPVGAAQGPPRGAFHTGEARAVLGRGTETFARAVRALDAWRHFNLGWVTVHPPTASTSEGTNVLVVAQHLGFWSVNACRVLYRLANGTDTDVAGFAYGTLEDHTESGEELFQVAHDRATGEVSYMVRAVSRERAALARLGYPVARLLQARFRRESAAAMRRAVTESGW